MDRKSMSGKSGILLLLVVVGIAIVVGAWFLLTMKEGPKDLNDPGPGTVEVRDTEVVADIEGTEGEAEVVDVEEEKPAMIRTVDAFGKKTWVKTDPVEIWRPGGKSVKMTGVMTETGVKMSPSPDKPDSKRSDTVHEIHPAKKKKLKKSDEESKEETPAEPPADGNT